MANPTKAELLAKAAELGIEVAEDATNAQIAEAIKKSDKNVEAAPVQIAVEDKSTPSETVNVASEIGAAIAQAITSTKEDKNIKFTSDPGVVPRFALVKNKSGDVLIRENESGRLSELQLKSIEEKQALVQDQEVEEL